MNVKEEEVAKVNKWLKERHSLPFVEVSSFPNYLKNNTVYYVQNNKKITFKCWMGKSLSMKTIKFSDDLSKSPLDAFKTMQKVYKQPNLYKVYLDKEKTIKNPYHLEESILFDSYWNDLLTYFDNSYADQVLEVWYYDINAAYGSILSQPLPDFKQPHRVRPEDDMFFVAFNKQGFVVDNDSEEAILWFPLMESPYIEAVKRWRKNKNLKYVYTMGTGYMSYDKTQPNRLMFNWVVYKLTKKVLAAVKGKKFVRIWVDGVYALEPLDVKVSKEIGDWSHDYQGLAQFRNVAYFRTEKKIVPNTKSATYYYNWIEKEIKPYEAKNDISNSIEEDEYKRLRSDAE